MLVVFDSIKEQIIMWGIYRFLNMHFECTGNTELMKKFVLPTNAGHHLFKVVHPSLGGG